MPGTKNSSLKIGKRAFLSAMIILLCLMTFSGILTVLLPSGSYERYTDDRGRTLIVPDSYRETAKPHYPFWRWFTAPGEVLFSPNNIALITIILFLLFVSGSITILEVSEVMSDLLGRLVKTFNKRTNIFLWPSSCFWPLFWGSTKGWFP